MAVFTSTIRALSHSTLNWDGQLNNDMGALETLLENSTHVDRGAAPADWNNAQKPGTYRTNYGATTYTNAPSGGYGYGTLLVLNGSGASITQVYFTHGPNNVYYRTAYATTDWTSWAQLAKAADTTALGARIDGVYTDYDGGRIDYRADTRANLQIDARGINIMASGAVAGVLNNTPVHVDFPTSRFPSGSSPIVVCTPNSGANVSPNSATPYNITNTGFDLEYQRGNTSSATINWIAMLTR